MNFSGFNIIRTAQSLQKNPKFILPIKRLRSLKHMWRMKLSEWENIGNCRLKTFCQTQTHNGHNGSFHSVYKKWRVLSVHEPCSVFQKIIFWESNYQGSSLSCLTDLMKPETVTVNRFCLIGAVCTNYVCMISVAFTVVPVCI